MKATLHKSKYSTLLIITLFYLQSIVAQNNTVQNNNIFLDKSYIDYLIDEYQYLGLFDHLSPAEIATGRLIATEMPITTIPEILMCFPKMLAFFNWETSNFQNPYQELLLEFAAVSRGCFVPEQIVDNFSQNKYKASTPLAFQCNQQSYSKSFNMMGKYLSPKVLILMEQALRDLQVQGRWYVCFSNPSAVAYLFLTDDQYLYLKTYQPELFSFQRDSSL